ncbi:MAG: oligosaccharide repeat unit polymerase, partial [Clostridia bacterium]|nr:oligosaccharide repeat unit polymerase [Clostridia bacterium]
FFMMLFFIKKYKRKVSLEVITFGIFSFFALMGFLTYGAGIYESTFGKKNEQSLSVIPYIYCFLFVLITCIPLRGNLGISNQSRSINPRKRNVIISIFFYIQLFSLILSLILLAQRGFSLDYAEIYADAANGVSEQFNSPLLQFLYSKSLFVFRIAPFFIWFFCFQILKEKWSSKAFIFIVMTFVSQIIPCVLNANRGGMFFCSVLFFAYYLFFRKKIVGKAQRSIYVSFVALSICVAMFSFAISLSRAGDNADEAKNAVILRYFGEPFPNLGFNIWGHNINHPMGSRFFPSIFGTNISSYAYEGRNGGFLYWEHFVGIRMLNFKTIFGDTYIEFGVVGGFIFLIITTGVIYLCCRIVPKSLKPIVYFFYFNTCVWNVFLNKWGDERTWKDFLLLLIIIFFINKYCRSKITLDRKT